MQLFNEIISNLYNNRELNECLRRFVPERHRDDFKQDLFILLLSKKDNVLRAEADGKLLFYTVRVILYMTSREGVLNRNYIKKEFVEFKSEPCEESFPLEIRRMKEDKEDEIIDRLESSESELNTPYYRLLAEALKRLGTAGKVSKETGIPKSSVQVGIRKIRKFLKGE